MEERLGRDLIDHAAVRKGCLSLGTRGIGWRFAIPGRLQRFGIPAKVHATLMPNELLPS